MLHEFMKINEKRRIEVSDRMADHILEYGLAAANLRDLAAAAGTSDRMLLYYFKDKDELMAAVLQVIAMRLTHLLNIAIPASIKLPYKDLLQKLWAVVGSTPLKPFMHVWMELITSKSDNGQNTQTSVAAAIIDGFALWITDHLDQTPNAKHAEVAALLLATLDGLLLLDMAGRRDLTDKAVLGVIGQ